MIAKMRRGAGAFRFHVRIFLPRSRQIPPPNLVNAPRATSATSNDPRTHRQSVNVFRNRRVGIEHV
jgi:hypothetical protein